MKDQQVHCYKSILNSASDRLGAKDGIEALVEFLRPTNAFKKQQRPMYHTRSTPNVTY